MKNILHIFVLFLTVIAISCDDSFLEENKKQLNGFELQEKVTIPFNAGPNQINISASEFSNNDASFSIVQFPKSMRFENFTGKISNNTLSLPYFFDGVYSNQYGTPTDVGSIIVKIDGLGYLKINIVTINYGNPIIGVDKNELDFGVDIVSLRLELRNKSEGMLLYNFNKYPDWIYINEAHKKGTLGSFSSKYVEVRCNRYNLEQGSHEGTIEILNEITNEVEKIPVKMIVSGYMNPKSILDIDGLVTDAEFDKIANTIYVSTQNPNKLISYNIERNEKKEISLDRNVNCITLSDDNKQIFVGQSAKLTHIDAATFSVIKSYDLSFNVKDIVYDESEYCYLSYKGSGFDYLNYITRLNLKTSSTNTYTISEMSDNTNLFKVKNTSYFFAARESQSPSGVILFDTSTNEPKIAKYWHTDEGVRFWFSEDQKYMYTQYGKVYLRPTEQTQDNLTSLGLLNPYASDINYSFYRYNWIDHCAHSKSIWAAYNMGNPTVTKNIVTEFDDVTYTRKRVLPLNDYHKTLNGVDKFYPTNAFYVFANKNGNKIALIKNVEENELNAWHLEIIDVSK